MDASLFWNAAREQLDGLPRGRGLNIAHEAVDRHACGPAADRTALLCIGRHETREAISYAELSRRTNRFAGALAALGTARGDRVATLLGRVPEQHVTALGALKAGAVFCPLFSAFGPEPLRQRLALAAVRVLVTTEALYRRRVAALRDALAALEHVLLVGTDVLETDGAVSFGRVLAASDDAFSIPATDPEDPALLHFTSGTTGPPKGAVHVHGAVVAHSATAQWALGLRGGDVYWCTADPGWVTGTSYGIVAPLVQAATAVLDEGELDAQRWYRLLQDERVQVWYTAPTALRMLARAGRQVPSAYDLSALRHVASVGEPLDAQVVRWGRDVLGHAVHDTWWQTETGSILIAEPPGAAPVAGSIGVAAPGVDVAVLVRGEDGRALVEDGVVTAVDDPDEPGELAVHAPWPSMFRAYLGDDARYAAAFAAGWYLTGDLARRGRDGRFRFVGRADDMIKTAGHLVGPFEVESVLLEHPAVAEAGVIGVPHPVAGQVVKAFVTLQADAHPDDALRRELLGFARSRLGPAVAPRSIAFTADLPRTRSGKIARRLLRARELGRPEGDVSTIDD